MDEREECPPLLGWQKEKVTSKIREAGMPETNVTFMCQLYSKEKKQGKI